MNDLSLHLLDIVQNSIRAKADDIHVHIYESVAKNNYQVSITDNGHGMSADTLHKAVDPFYTSRSTRKFGFGLAFLKQNAEQSGGELVLKSVEGEGTSLRVNFQLNHWDRPTAGRIGDTMALLICTNNALSITYKHSTDKGIFIISSTEIKKAIGNLPINIPQVIQYIKQMINENLKEIQADNE